GGENEVMRLGLRRAPSSCRRSQRGAGALALTLAVAIATIAGVIALMLVHDQILDEQPADRDPAAGTGQHALRLERAQHTPSRARQAGARRAIPVIVTGHAARPMRCYQTTAFRQRMSAA